MAKRVANGLSSMKRNLTIMGESLEKLDLNDSIKRIKFENIKEIDQKDIGTIVKLVKKYNGVIYGTSIASSIDNKKAPVRKTSDLDIKFRTRKDQKAFANEIVKYLGKDYTIHKGHFGESIKRVSDKKSIIDTSLIPKGYNHHKNNIYDVTLENEEKFIDMHTKHPKVVNYKSVKGESYSTSSQRKIHAALTDASLSRTLKDERLKADKQRRSGKDFFDVRTYSADGYIKAMDAYNKERDPKKKKQLKALINKYGRAILNFSADENVLALRQQAEEKYISDGMLSVRHFTSYPRNKMESNLYKKIHENPKTDLTKEGTRWIENRPLNEGKHKNRRSSIRVNPRNMF